MVQETAHVLMSTLPVQPQPVVRPDMAYLVTGNMRVTGLCPDKSRMLPIVREQNVLRRAVPRSQGPGRRGSDHLLE